MIRAFIALLFCFFTFTHLTAQDFDSRLTPVLQEFRAFNYENVVNRSTELLSGAAGLTRQDSLELYRLIAISQFSLLNMTEALTTFGMLLKLDPDYRLDVLDSPPKIINFFTAVKRLDTGEQPSTLTVIQYDTVYRRSFHRDRQVAYSLLFPGLGHLYGDAGSKGWLLVSAGAISLTAAIYFSIDSADKEDAYLKETDPARIEKLYDKYNEAYRLRNLSYLLFGALWTYAQVDLLLLQDVRLTDNLSFRFNPAGQSPFIISYYF